MDNVFDLPEEQVNTNYVPIEQQVFDDPSVENLISRNPPSMGQKAWNWLTSPQDPQEPSLANIALSGVAGGVLGSESLGLGYGTGVGTIGGLFSGVAGEIARSQGASPLVTFTSELAAGGVPSAAIAGKQALKAVSYRGGRAAELLPDSREALALKTAKEKLFGKNTVDVIYTTKNSDETQINLAKEYLPNTVLPSDKTVSSVFRENMYREIAGLKKPFEFEVMPTGGNLVPFGQKGAFTPTKTIATDPILFSKSPQFKALQEDLLVLKERLKLSPKERANLNKLVMNDNHPNAQVQEKSIEDLVNLIQNGGSTVVSKIDGKPQTQQLIPEPAQEVLRKHFNDFLETNLGKREYDKLKAIEQAEGIAKARDTIPTLLDANFKFGSEEYKRIVGYIKQSPEGKEDFKKALLQHFSTFDNTKAMKTEFVRLRGAIEQSGILKREDLANLSQKINSFDRKVTKENVLATMRTSILSTLGSAVTADTVGRSDKLIPKELNMNVFGL